MQDARTQLDNEFRMRQEAINREYQEKMQGIINQANQYFQPPVNNYPQQPITPVNSEIQNAFMRSPEYQQTFQNCFNQFLMQNFFHQFQSTKFYAELKKYADSAYPEFEKKYIAAVNQQKDDVKPEKPKKDESIKTGNS